MAYNFTENYSKYILENFIIEKLDIENKKTINIVKDIIYKNAEIVDLCKLIDEDFDNILLSKLKENNIVYQECETIDKNKNIYEYSQFTFNEFKNNGFTIRYAKDDMAKISFMSEYLKKVENLKALLKDAEVKKYIKLQKEQEKIINTKNAVIKFFALRKVRRDLILLNTNISVYSYTSLLKYKDMLNSIISVQNELSDEKLLKCDYVSIENELASKANEENSFEEEKEVYKQFYLHLGELQEKLDDLTKCDPNKTQLKSNIDFADEDEFLNN